MRENWEKYGNPDGPTSQTYGIALPSWMVEGKQSALVMLAYAAGIGLIIMFVRSRWNRSKKATDKTISEETQGLFVLRLRTEPDDMGELAIGLQVWLCGFDAVL